jgi:hypothetical protein
MKLSNFKLLARGYIPGAKAQIITPSVLELILNAGVNNIAAYTACLKANKKFTITANKADYALSTVIGDYLTTDKSGLWWNDGSQWVRLNSRTLAWLDEQRPNWRDLDAGSPQEYSIDGDILTLVPEPNTTLANGLWLYYGKAPTPMTAEDHYSFSGSATEFTHLKVFDDAVLEYAEWRINPILNKDQTEDITEGQFKRAREEAFTIFKKRRDIGSDKDARFQGPKVR